ncbi:MAG TPA: VWA domain-containing protein, partial [Acidobacteria bacterium]|nr:VWA domain-containing protein [Acidobacteriota bacterium]
MAHGGSNPPFRTRSQEGQLCWSFSRWGGEDLTTLSEPAAELAQLLGGADSLVDQLTAKHNVELLALTGRRFKMLWHPGAIGDADTEDESNSGYLPPPETLQVAATNMMTDLATAIEEGVVGDASKDKLYVVIFTDGQHNVDGASPLEMARQFKERGVPVHAVGLGT